MEWTVKRINGETFKIQGEIEIRFTRDQIASELKEFLRAELEKQRAWLKETLKTIQAEKSAPLSWADVPTFRWSVLFARSKQ